MDDIVLTKATSFILCVEIVNMAEQSGALANVQTIWGTATTPYVGLSNVARIVSFFDGGGSALAFAFTSAVIGTGLSFRCCFSKPVDSNTITCTLTNLASGLAESADATFPADMKSMTINRIGSRGNNDRPLRSAFMNERIVVNGVTVVDRRYERSTYDISGNGYHGTITGTVDLEATYENANGVYSYNLNNGFDRYTDDATGLITRDVPYIDGVPVVSSITGYTKQSSHPAGQNNMAWGFVDFKGTQIDSLYLSAPVTDAKFELDTNFTMTAKSNFATSVDFIAIDSDDNEYTIVEDLAVTAGTATKADCQLSSSDFGLDFPLVTLRVKDHDSSRYYDVPVSLIATITIDTPIELEADTEGTVSGTANCDDVELFYAPSSGGAWVSLGTASVVAGVWSIDDVDISAGTYDFKAVDPNDEDGNAQVDDVTVESGVTHFDMTATCTADAPENTTELIGTLTIDVSCTADTPTDI